MAFFEFYTWKYLPYTSKLKAKIFQRLTYPSSVFNETHHKSISYFLSHYGWLCNALRKGPLDPIHSGIDNKQPNKMIMTNNVTTIIHLFSNELLPRVLQHNLFYISNYTNSSKEKRYIQQFNPWGLPSKIHYFLTTQNLRVLN